MQNKAKTPRFWGVFFIGAEDEMQRATIYSVL